MRAKLSITAILTALVLAGIMLLPIGLVTAQTINDGGGGGGGGGYTSNTFGTPFQGSYTGYSSAYNYPNTNTITWDGPSASASNGYGYVYTESSSTVMTMGDYGSPGGTATGESVLGYYVTFFPTHSGTYTVQYNWHYVWDVSVSSTPYETDVGKAEASITMMGNGMDRGHNGVYILGSTWASSTVKDWYVENGRSYSEHSGGYYCLSYSVYMIAGHQYILYGETHIKTYSFSTTDNMQSSAWIDMSNRDPWLDWHQDEGAWLQNIQVSGYY